MMGENQVLGEVKIRGGIFQTEALKMLLFVMSMTKPIVQVSSEKQPLGMNFHQI